jgi:hypothetical protein
MQASGVGSSKPVIPSLEQASLQGYQPGHLGVREKNSLMAEKGHYWRYLFTVATYKFEITATTVRSESR